MEEVLEEEVLCEEAASLLVVSGVEVALSIEEVSSVDVVASSEVTPLEDSPAVASVDTVSPVELSVDTVSPLGVQDAKANIQATAIAKINKTVFFIFLSPCGKLMSLLYSIQAKKSSQFLILTCALFLEFSVLYGDISSTDFERGFFVADEDYGLI